MSMKNSVAMCTYNGEEYLVCQIESILNQTVKPDEIFICDDCSTDNTLEILKNYQNKFPELITVQINEKNIGYIKNFEKAISLCSGEIIFLSDQDDIWYEHKIETITKEFLSKPDIHYIFTDATAIDNKNNKLGYNTWAAVNFDKKKQIDFNNGNQLQLLINNYFVTGATVALKSDIRKFISPFPINVYHDYWLAIVLNSINSTAGYCLTEPLIKYRIHEKQIIGVPKVSVLNNEKNSKLKVIFKSHYEYYKERIIIFTALINRINNFNIKKEVSVLINDLLQYYSLRNEMYEKNRKKSFLLIKKLINKKHYSKFAYSRTFVITRDLIEKVLLNRKEKPIC